jgi:hypothetical protein
VVAQVPRQGWSSLSLQICVEPIKLGSCSGNIFSRGAFCLRGSRESPEVLLPRLDVIAVIGVTPVTSIASELSKSEGDEISAMDKVTLSEPK